MGTHVEADDRDPDTVRFDLLVDQVNALVGKMDAVIETRGSNTQTVIHKTAGIGPWAAAACCACFCTMIGLVIVTVVLSAQLDRESKAFNDQMRDVQAWQDVMRQRLSKLEAK